MFIRKLKKKKTGYIVKKYNKFFQLWYTYDVRSFLISIFLLITSVNCKLSFQFQNVYTYMSSRFSFIKSRNEALRSQFCEIKRIWCARRFYFCSYQLPKIVFFLSPFESLHLVSVCKCFVFVVGRML
jgi:hypothetical protein